MPAVETQPVKNPLGRLKDFWAQMSEGMALEQLWSNFKDEAHATYRLYSADIQRSGKLENLPQKKRHLAAAKAFVWAVLMKLSPPRRIALFFALVLVFFPTIEVHGGRGLYLDSGLFHFIAFLLVLGVLVAEVADRVTMKRDLQIAREIQGWLVPSTAPTVPGYEFAFTMRPANTVAGDYYDLFFRPAENGTERLVLVMADVAGKSMPAALLMACFQASVRTLAAAPGSLAQLMAGLNRYACQQSQDGRRFTTCFLAELNPQDGHITYINAGHNGPVLLRAGGMDRLSSTTVPLGIDSSVQYSPQSVTLGPGDLLVMFTDGLAEAANIHDEEYTEQRLVSFLLGLHDRSASEVIMSIMGEIENFAARAPQHDDMTCMVVKRQ